MKRKEITEGKPSSSNTAKKQKDDASSDIIVYKDNLIIQTIQKSKQLTKQRDYLCECMEKLFNDDNITEEERYRQNQILLKNLDLLIKEEKEFNKVLYEAYNNNKMNNNK